MPIIVAFIILSMAVALGGVFQQRPDLLPANLIFPPFPTFERPEKTIEINEPEGDSGNIVIPKPKPKPETPIEKEEKEEPKSPALVNTYMISGPRNGAIIENTNKITFKFGGEILSEEIEGTMVFETKVEGLDENWKQTSSQKRTVTFPLGPGEYIFLARTKIKNTDIVDPTPIKREFAIDISPYFNKVKISKFENASRPDPFLITLSTNLSWGDNTKINITGWEIEGEYGSFEIGQGVEYLNPSVDDIVYKDIVIKRGDTVYISSAPNPLGAKDRHFKTNKCTGYLTSSHSFPVSISKNCPRLEKEDLPWDLSYYCKEYILDLGRCERPNYEGMAKYNLFAEPECTNFMNTNLSYRGCYDKHYRDNNFLENKWYIYLNRADKQFFDSSNDTIYVRDKDGLLIYEYRYGKKP